MASPPGELVGRVLGGRYRLLALVGTGASAHVYLADDVKLRRRVAVKVLHAALADDDAFLRRFRVEAQSAAQLAHPNIVVVHDWNDGTDALGDPPYLVTEYLEGGSLRSVLDLGHRLSPSQALLVGLEAARALAHAHGKGYVHRDIKPANLLFGADGRVRISDFGLARALAEAAWTEPMGAVLGTARYAAPEQARGQSVDGRADVYALALVLIESVTGTVPFSADTTIGTLMARLDQPLVPPAELGALADALTPAGAVRPDERCDAAALVAILEVAARRLPRPAPVPLAGTTVARRGFSADLDPTLHGLATDDAVRLADPGTAPVAPSAVRAASPVPVAAAPPAPPAVPAAPSAAGAVAGSPPSPGSPASPAAPVARGANGNGAAPPSIGTVFDDEVAPVEPGALDLDLLGGVVPELTTELARPGAGGPDAGGHEPAPRGAEHGDRHGFHDGADDGGDERRARHRWPWVAAVLLVLAGGAAGAWWGFLRPISHDVPVVVGQDSAAAARALDRLDLDLVVAGRAYDEQRPAGEVLSQAPAAGTSLREGGDVRVVVSRGAAPRPVPDLTGMTEAAAREALAAAGLVVTEPVTKDRAEDVPAGSVISWGPTGTVDKGSAVTLTVSEGPPLRVVPKFTGLSAEAARRAVPDGLTVTIVEQFSETVEKGIVFRSSVAAGTAVEKGTRIVLTMSKGPELVTVPDVRGKSPAEAERALNAAGLRVVGITGSPTRPVTRTSPATGAAVRVNSPVTLVTQ